MENTSPSAAPTPASAPSASPSAPAPAASDPSASTLNISGSGSSVLQYEIAEQTAKSYSGANWFFWIAGLSLVNSVIVLMNGQWSFLAGLGVTQIIDGMAQALLPRLGTTATVLALVMDLAAAGVVVTFGLMARQGHGWAFILGMILYALDGLIFLLVGALLSLAFHAYALYCIYRGYAANNRLRQIREELQGQPA